MIEPRLSICIATFNRAHFIVETLGSIAAQASPGVEIVVVDGASTDATCDRVKEFQAGHPSLRYHREAQNSGIDRDFDKAVGYARGRYVWLMTDDDVMVEGAIPRVLSALEQHPDLVVVNSEVRDANLDAVLCNRLIDVDQDRFYAGGDDSDRFFLQVAQGLTFIGCVVIRRSLWLARERSAYFGSLFVHVGVIFQSPPIDRIHLIAEPLLRIRYGVAMWTPRSFDVWMYKWPKLIWSFDCYDPSVRAGVTAERPWQSPAKLFHFRAKQSYSVAEYHRHLAQTPVPYRWIAYLVSVFPAALANICSVVYVAVSSPTNRIPLYDLIYTQRVVWLRRMLRRVFRL